MTVPRDLLEEIHRELLDSSDALTRECKRLANLIELNRLALAASMRLGRPASVVDLLDNADHEQSTRLTALVRALREGAADRP